MSLPLRVLFIPTELAQLSLIGILLAIRTPAKVNLASSLTTYHLHFYFLCNNFIHQNYSLENDMKYIILYSDHQLFSNKS